MNENCFTCGIASVSLKRVVQVNTASAMLQLSVFYWCTARNEFYTEVFKKSHNVHHKPRTSEGIVMELEELDLPRSASLRSNQVRAGASGEESLV